MIRRAVLGMVAIAAMASPATAWAGGFTTVGLHELPTDVRAGVPWTAEFTVLGHGRAPSPGLSPTVTIARADGTGARTFTAMETRQPGVYRADVIFPADGAWTLAITEWASAPASTFGTVEVGSPSQSASRATVARREPATPDGGDPWAAALAAIAAGLLAGVAASVLLRRDAPSPA